MIALAIFGAIWLGSLLGLVILAPDLARRAFAAILDEVRR